MYVQSFINVFAVFVVVGNEAADADSIVSAICLAFLRHKKCSSIDPAKDTRFIPIAHVSRSLLHLRRDIHVLLLAVGLAPSDIICIDDINISSIYANNTSKTILVDQNTVPPGLREFSTTIDEIIDHHSDLNQCPWVMGDKRVIAFDFTTAKPLVGSSCTLVAEEFRGSEWMTPEIAHLLLGVISLDTFNMDAVINKGTPRDATAMEWLHVLAGVDKDKLFASLRDSKLDPLFWNEISSLESFQLDYKLFLSIKGIKIGVSSVLLSSNDIIKKQDFLTSCKIFLEDTDVDVFVIMAFRFSPEPMREILCASRSLEMLNAFEFHLTGSVCAEARITPFRTTSPRSETEECMSPQDKPNYCLDYPDIHWRRYDQGNIAYSRKQMAGYFIAFSIS